MDITRGEKPYSMEIQKLSFIATRVDVIIATVTASASSTVYSSQVSAIKYKDGIKDTSIIGMYKMLCISLSVYTDILFL